MASYSLRKRQATEEPQPVVTVPSLRTSTAKGSWQRVRKYESSRDVVSEILQRGHNLHPQRNFGSLYNLLNELQKTEPDTFKYILEEVVPKIEFLAREFDHDESIDDLAAGAYGKVTLSKRKIAQILANAFFCTLDEKPGYPDLNFIRLYGSYGDENVKKEKIKCLITYFRSFCKEGRNNIEDSSICVEYQRFCINNDTINWMESTESLCPVKILKKKSMFDCDADVAQVDFANKRIGGGVLGSGCVQEEIKFITCPELIAARLFTEELQYNEALIITGAKPYSTASGYRDSFKYVGEADQNKKCSDTLIVIDAVDCSQIDGQQYTKYCVDREIHKAYVGFSNCHLEKIATGNWGGGAFQGDAALKFLIQWIAASKAGKSLQYFCFNERSLYDTITKVYEGDFKSRKQWNIGWTYRYILEYYCGEKISRQNFPTQDVPTAEEAAESYDMLSDAELGEITPYKPDETPQNGNYSYKRERKPSSQDDAADKKLNCGQSKELSWKKLPGLSIDVLVNIICANLSKKRVNDPFTSDQKKSLLRAFETAFASIEQDSDSPELLKFISLLASDSYPPLKQDFGENNKTVNRRQVWNFLSSAFFCNLNSDRTFTFEKLFESADNSYSVSKLFALIQHFNQLSKLEDSAHSWSDEASLHVCTYTSDRLPWNSTTYCFTKMRDFNFCKPPTPQHVLVCFGTRKIGENTWSSATNIQDKFFIDYPELILAQTHLVPTELGDKQAVMVKILQPVTAAETSPLEAPEHILVIDPITEDDLMKHHETSTNKTKRWENCQYDEQIIIRELNKAYAGFICVAKYSATKHVLIKQSDFGGFWRNEIADQILYARILHMAASLAGVDIYFCSDTDNSEVNERHQWFKKYSWSIQFSLSTAYYYAIQHAQSKRNII